MSAAPRSRERIDIRLHRRSIDTRDGRVIGPSDASGELSGYTLRLSEGQLSRDQLTALIERSDRSGLFQSGEEVNFGSPSIFDASQTELSFRNAAGDLVTRSVYALGHDLGSGSGVTRAEQDRRDLLAALVNRAVDNVELTQPYLPQRVEVRAVNDEYGALRGISNPPDWPGPDLDEVLRVSVREGQCGVVSGRDAARLWDAARQNPDIAWSDHGRERLIVLVGMLPGEPACS